MQHMRDVQLKHIRGATVAKYTVQLFIWLSKQT